MKKGTPVPHTVPENETLEITEKPTDTGYGDQHLREVSGKVSLFQREKKVCEYEALPQDDSAVGKETFDLIEQGQDLRIELLAKLLYSNFEAKNEQEFQTELHSITKKFKYFVDNFNSKTPTQYASQEKKISRLRSSLSRAERCLENGERLDTGMIDALLTLGTEEHFQELNRLLYNNANSKFLSVNVYFENLTFSTSTHNSTLPEWLQGPETVANTTGRVSLGWFFHLRSAILSCTKGRKDEPKTKVLNSLSGVMKAGELTLLLGPAGSGKSSLMHSLTNRIRKGDINSLEGSIQYNGHNINDIHVPTFATYVDQVDNHIANLTVEETIAFAKACRSFTGTNMTKIKQYFEMDNDQGTLYDEYNRKHVQVIMTFLGLIHAADTVIGNAILKGVSGGEKRRVTLAEMLVIGGKVLFLDEISTGLDSAATFDITNMLKSLAHVFQFNIVVSLLQPPPETYDLFDKIILMSEGNIIYHGPRANILEYFESIGYHKPDKQDTADFLISLASMVNIEKFVKPIFDQSRIPKTPDEFAAEYKQSMYFAEMKKEIETNAQGRQSNEFGDVEKWIAEQPKYRKSIPALTRIVFSRQWKLFKRNKAFIIARIVNNLIFGAIFGMLCWQLPFNSYYVKVQVLFNMLTFVGFASLSLIPGMISSRDIFYKQKRENFFPSISFVLAEFVTSLPQILLDAMVLGSLIYFMCGMTLADNGKHYFVFLVILISWGVCMTSIVRLVALSSRNAVSATATIILVVISMIIFSGSVVTKAVLPDYYIWLYWVNPLTWAYTSLTQNEFYSGTYQDPPNTIDGQCARYCGSDDCKKPWPEMSCGEYFLQARQFPVDEAYLWGGFGYLWLCTFLTVLLSTLSLKYICFDDDVASAAASVVRKSAHFYRKKKAPKGEGESADDSLASANQNNKGFPFEPVTLSFRNLRYYVEIPISKAEIDQTADGIRRDAKQKAPKTHTLEILKGVSGFAKPHEMTALMGSSGAGKTTLMDVIAGRKTTGKITGNIFVNGKPKNNKTFPKLMGYVEQFGIHLEKSTVKEALYFSAALRLSKEITADPRTMDAIVDYVLKVLELDDIENRLVGNADTGLSFEEVKRLTIGVEMVANPSVIFADEPTSGLEARSAMVVMRCLRNIAASGRTVVVTVHQPNVAIFNMFDKLLLMKRGGEVVFFDSLGNASEKLLDYFEGFPGVDRCPKNLNPATWMLTVIGAGVGAEEGMDFALEYRKSKMYQETLKEIDVLMPTNQEYDAGNSNSEALLLDEKHESSKYSTSFTTQVRLLFKRNYIEYWRTPSYGFIRLISITGLSIVVGLVFVGGTMHNSADVQSRLTSINLIVTLAGNYNVVTIIPFMFSHKALFYRERASKLYTGYAYAIACTLVEDVYIFVEVVLAVICFYFLCGFVTQPLWPFFYYWLVFWIYVMLQTFVGFLLSSVLPNAASAQIVASLYNQICSLFSGIFVPPNQMPSYLIWLYYLSPVRWVQEALITTQFNFIEDPICDPVGEPYFIKSGDSCENHVDEGYNQNTFTDKVNNRSYCCPAGTEGLTARQYVLDNFLGGDNGYSYEWRWYDVIFLLSVMILVRIIGIVTTHHLQFNKR